MKLSSHLITKVNIMFNINEESPVSHVYKLNAFHPEYYNLKFIESNRKANNQNVNKLIKSIQDNNLLHAAPIIVQVSSNNDLQIIDGQHRYLAAKYLRVPIYIHILSDAKYNIHSSHIMSSLNSNQKNWGLGDFAHHYANCYNSELSEKYSDYLDIYNTFFNGPNGPGITHGLLICITENKTTKFSNNIEFKKGKLNWDHSIKQNIYNIYNKFNEIKELTSKPTLTKQTLKKQQFQYAILTALNNEFFNYKLFLKNLHIFPNNFNKLNKKVDMLAEIYKIESIGCR